MPESSKQSTRTTDPRHRRGGTPPVTVVLPADLHQDDPIGRLMFDPGHFQVLTEAKYTTVLGLYYGLRDRKLHPKGIKGGVVHSVWLRYCVLGYNVPSKAPFAPGRRENVTMAPPLVRTNAVTRLTLPPEVHEVLREQHKVHTIHELLDVIGRGAIRPGETVNGIPIRETLLSRLIAARLVKTV